MELQLQYNLELFIIEQVKAGRFPTPEAVVEASLTRMMEEEVELTDEDVAAINLSEQQFARGEGISSKEVAARMRRMYGTPQNGAPKT